MKTFNKPDWYNVDTKYKNRFQLLSTCFRDCSISNEELATVFAPIVTMSYPERFSLDVNEAVGYYSDYRKKYVPTKNNAIYSNKSENKSCVPKYDAEDVSEEDILIEDFDEQIYDIVMVCHLFMKNTRMTARNANLRYL